MEQLVQTSRRKFLSATITLVGLVSVAGCGGSNIAPNRTTSGSSTVPQGNIAFRAIAIAAHQSLAGGRFYPLAAIRLAAPAGSQFTTRAVHRDVPTTIVYDDGLKLYKKYSSSGATVSVSYFTDAAGTVPAGVATVTQDGVNTFTNDYATYPTTVTFSADTTDGTVPFRGSGSITYRDASGANTLTGSFTSKRNNVTLSGTLDLDGAGNVTGSMTMVQGTVTTQVTGITGQLSGDLSGTVTSQPYGWSGTLRFNLSTGVFTLTLNTGTGASSATLDASGNLVIRFADGTTQTIVNPLNEFLDGTSTGPTPTPVATATPVTPPSPGTSGYTAILLHSSALYNSVATGVSGAFQVGNGYPRSATDTFHHALLWNGTAASVVDLHPAGFYQSFATGVSGNTQGGYAIYPESSAKGSHAFLWHGTAASAVDLNVEGASSTLVVGVSGDSQVGNLTYLNSPFQAVLWKGTPDSIVYLQPDGFVNSTATGISGNFQVGYGDIATGGRHALLWKGTAASVVDLHPTSFYQTFATAASDTTQVGYGVTGQYAEPQALLWTGTAQSVVNLQPEGFNSTQANGASGVFQVGQGRPSSGPDQANQHALLWKGTAASVVDLHPATQNLTLNGTPLGAVASVATGIDSDGNIVGYVRDLKDIQYAVLWVKQ